MAQRDIGCEDCGAVIPMQISSVSLDRPNVWYPGKKCPMCGSAKFMPIIAITETDRRSKEPVSLKRRLLLNPWTGVIAAVVTVVFVLGIVFWPTRQRDRGEQALFFCEHCGELFFAKKAAVQPVKCPKCGHKAGYRAAACVKCSRVLSFHPKPCPHCGEHLRTMLTTMKEAQEAKRAHAEYLKREEEMKNNEEPHRH